MALAAHVLLTSIPSPSHGVFILLGSVPFFLYSFLAKKKKITTTLPKKPSVVYDGQQREVRSGSTGAASSEWTCSCAATSASRLAYLSQNQTRYGSLAFHPPEADGMPKTLEYLNTRMLTP
jgi:hypothetical protein